jgi:zinc/manganese transport system permease protein
MAAHAEAVLGDHDLRLALVAGIAIAMGSAPIGVFLTLRRMSLMGDALSHALLPGVGIAFVMAGSSIFAMMVGGLVAGLVVALAAALLSRLTIQKEDANLAALFLVALASGVAVISASGEDEEILHILFGSPFDIDATGVVTLAAIATLTLVALAVLYRPLVMECFDPSFLRTVSNWSAPAHFSFLALVVLNLIAAFYAVGTLLALGLMILPAVAARFWVRGLMPMILLAMAIGILGLLSGLSLAHYGDLTPGPAVVLVLGAIFAVSFTFGPHGSLMARRTPRFHLER